MAMLVESLPPTAPKAMMRRMIRERDTALLPAVDIVSFALSAASAHLHEESLPRSRTGSTA